MTVEFKLNGDNKTVTVDESVPLLYVLRNDLGLNGPKFGCGLAQCGACTVLVDGVPTRSCITPVASVQRRDVTTLEGLGSPDNPHPLQSAFIEEQALQCGYCGNGVLMAAAALLQNNPRPSEDDVNKALDGHLCRCGIQGRMVRAILRAAQAGGSGP